MVMFRMKHHTIKPKKNTDKKKERQVKGLKAQNSREFNHFG